MSNVRYNSTGERSTLKVSRQSSTPVNNTAFVCWCCPKMLLHVAPLDRRTIDIYLIVFAEIQYLNLFTTVTLSIPLKTNFFSRQRTQYISCSTRKTTTTHTTVIVPFTFLLLHSERLTLIDSSLLLRDDHISST